MKTVIDLGSELLVDASTVADPYARLLAAVVGERLAPGSPWVAVDKRVAAYFHPTPAAACRFAEGGDERPRIAS